MKKIIINTLFLSLLSTSAMAINEGFYAGLGIGFQDMFNDLSAHDVDQNGSNTANIDLGATGALGSLALGYNFLFGNQFLLGLQLDGQISGLKNTMDILDFDGPIVDNNSITGKYKHSFGLNVRPGLSFNENASGFLVLGYRHAKMNYDFYESETGTPVTNFSLNQNTHGFEYGLGTELCLNDQVGLRLEVSQTQYQSKDVYSAVGQGSLSAKMKVNQGLLSLVWYPSYF